MIYVVDYGVGNVASLCNAIEEIGVACELMSSPRSLNPNDKLILPGVGAFPRAMNELKKAKLLEFLYDEVYSGRKLLGICLGMQILFEMSEEGQQVSGLSLLPGLVSRFRVSSGVRVPRIEWARIKKLKEHQLLSDSSERDFYYFLHSFYCPLDKNHTIASSEYGIEYSAVVVKNNLVGAQFHPEKSGRSGLRFLSNFANWK